MDILKRIESYNLFFDAKPTHMPTGGVPDGPLQGNGDLGASWCTQENALVCYYGKNDMWLAKPSQREGGVKNLAVLKLHLSDLNADVFHACCHLNNAEIEMELQTATGRLQVQSILPRKHNLALIHAACTEGHVHLSVDLAALEDHLAVCTRQQDGNNIQITKKYEGADVDWPTFACVSLRVLDWVGTEGDLAAGQSVTIAVSAFTNHDCETPVQAAENALNDLNVEKCLQDNTDWWKMFWKKSSVSLPDEPRIEKLWYASQYLLACCCEPGKFAPGIFGNFITTDRPDWGGDYHLNYNYQAAWWGAFSSNHLELTEPYDQPLMDYIPKAKDNAKTLLGCHGLYSAVGIGPKGNVCAAMFNDDGTENREAPFWGQKSNAGYAAVNMLMRVYSEWDENYIRKIAFPYISEALAFWEDYLTWEGDRYVIYHDCIHENSALARTMHGLSAGDDDHSDDMNPLVSLGLIHVMIKGALEMSELLGIDGEHQAKWRHIQEHLSAYPTQIRNGKKVFRYTESGMDWCDGNSLGIQHIYPCGAIGLNSEPELLTIARNTLQEMSRWDDYNALPTFYTAAARLGYDPDEILIHLNDVVQKRGFANGFIYCGGGGVECLSVVPGCIDEMLLQSHENVIRLFPVWNLHRDASFEHLRAYGAFLISANLHDGSIANVELFSEKGKPCTIQSPWENGIQVTCEGNLIPTQKLEKPWGEVYEFETEPNHTYQIQPAK